MLSPSLPQFEQLIQQACKGENFELQLQFTSALHQLQTEITTFQIESSKRTSQLQIQLEQAQHNYKQVLEQLEQTRQQLSYTESQLAKAEAQLQQRLTAADESRDLIDLLDPFLTDEGRAHRQELDAMMRLEIIDNYVKPDGKIAYGGYAALARMIWRLVSNYVWLHRPGTLNCPKKELWRAISLTYRIQISDHSATQALNSESI